MSRIFSMELTEKHSKQGKERLQKDILWEKLEMFTNAEQAEDYVKQQNSWSVKARYVDTEGSKIVRYRCNKVRTHGSHCKAQLRLISSTAGTAIATLYRSIPFKHTHDRILNVSHHKFNEHTKREIRKCVQNDERVKPKTIVAVLEKKGLTVPSKYQMNNYLSWLRKQVYGPRVVCVDDLQWILENESRIPPQEDTTKAFVLSHQLDRAENHCQFFVTTRRLLMNALTTRCVHMDSTYKLPWLGAYSIYFVGTMDRSKQFHCFGLAVCSANDFVYIFKTINDGVQQVCGTTFRPQTLVTDSIETVGSAFRNVFGEQCRVVVTREHVKRSIQQELEERLDNEDDISAIMEDVCVLQWSRNELVFRNAVKLFMDKWRDTFHEFVSYFEEHWVHANCGSSWYDGFDQQVFNTNSAIEILTKKLRQESKFRNRLPTEKLVPALLDIATNLSKDYQHKPLRCQPKMQIWNKAYSWVKLDKEIRAIKSADQLETSYLFAAELHQQTIDDQQVNICQLNSFQSFEQFKKVYFSHCTVVLPNPATKDNYLEGRCDCLEYLKNLICEHILGIAIKLEVVKPTEKKRRQKKIDRERERQMQLQQRLVQRGSVMVTTPVFEAHFVPGV